MSEIFSDICRKVGEKLQKAWSPIKRFGISIGHTFRQLLEKKGTEAGTVSSAATKVISEQPQQQPAQPQPPLNVRHSVEKKQGEDSESRAARELLLQRQQKPQEYNRSTYEGASTRFDEARLAFRLKLREGAAKKAKDPSFNRVRWAQELLNVRKEWEEAMNSFLKMMDECRSRKLISTSRIEGDEEQVRRFQKEFEKLEPRFEELRRFFEERDESIAQLKGSFHARCQEAERFIGLLSQGKNEEGKLYDRNTIQQMEGGGGPLGKMRARLTSAFEELKSMYGEGWGDSPESRAIIEFYGDFERKFTHPTEITRNIQYPKGRPLT